MEYKYRGFFCGCVPIRFNFEDDGLCIDIADDWYSPVWLLDAVAAVWDFVADCVGWDGGWYISHIKEIN